MAVVIVSALEEPEINWPLPMERLEKSDLSYYITTY